MKNFTAELARKINENMLHEKRPNQTVSSIDWKQVLIAIEHGFLSEKLARNFLFLIEKDINHFKDFPDFLHRTPTPEQLYAEGKPHIRLGQTVSDSMEIGVRFDLPLFMVCAGLTGFGKTTALRILLREIHHYNQKHPDKKISVIVFDRKGGDFADLAGSFGWKHFHVYKTLRVSLENPDGMPPDTWINIIASLFCARAGLKFAWTTFADALRTLLILMNPQPKERLDWPDFQAVLDFLNSLPETAFSTRSEYVRALKQALQAVCISSEKTFSASQGFRVEDFIQRGESAIIAMPNMEPGWVRQLLTDIIISQALRGRMERSERVDSVQGLFVVDEAGDDIHIESEQLFSSGMSPISECFKKSREFGLGLCISVSSLRAISQTIKENATAHLMFRPSDAKATDEAAETLMLPPYGGLTLGHLNKGECLFRQIGPWPHTVKVKIDYMPPSRVQITDYDCHPYKQSKPILQIPQVIEFIDKFKKTGKERKEKSDPNKELAIGLLKLAAINPYVPVGRLFECLGNYHYTVQKKIRSLIEDSGWAKFEEPRIGRSNILLIELAGTGYELIRYPVPTGNKGRGSISHRHYAHWIKRFFEKSGRKVQIEFVIPGTNHPSDVGVQTENKWLIFEICVTSFDNVISHINAVLSSDNVECLTIVASTETELNKLKKELKSQLVFIKYASQIKFEVITNYMSKEVKNATD
ncbi:MAG: ATP-binding protein [Sedimentisphaerales bacterium]